MKTFRCTERPSPGNIWIYLRLATLCFTVLIMSTKISVVNSPHFTAGVLTVFFPPCDSSVQIHPGDRDEHGAGPGQAVSASSFSHLLHQ